MMDIAIASILGEHQKVAATAEPPVIRSSTFKRLLDVHQQESIARIAQSVQNMNKTIASLQSVQPDTRPCGQIIGADLVVVDLEPAKEEKP